MSRSIVPYRLEIPDAALDDLRMRLANRRMPGPATVEGWRQGPPVDAIERLCAYWQEGYDWRRCEAMLNTIGQYRTVIDGVPIHFLHIRSAEPGAMPLLLCHGWPGSILEFRRLIGPLTDPVAHGGVVTEAFDLVIPSMPGFGFSGQPDAPGWDFARIGRAWAELMARLGYEYWMAQGGDLGSAVVGSIARQQLPGCIGIHLNLSFFQPSADEVAEADEEERGFLDRTAHYFREMAGYVAIQGTRPQTIGYALADSPAGQAAWIYEKFHEGADHRGDLSSAVIDDDDLLDTIMLYWLPNTGASSARIYWELQQMGPPPAEMPPITLPTGYSRFPGEIIRNSRRWMERRFSRLIHYGVPARGGHFAAMEQPALFAEEVRATLRAWRTDQGA